MKKLVKVLLFACLVMVVGSLLLTSCGNTSDQKKPNHESEISDSSASLSGPHVHVFGEWMNAVDPTCTEGGSKARQCECGEWDIEKLPPSGHQKGKDGYCPACNKPYGEWVVNYYVDEFKNPTDECYITNAYYWSGTFSNSATSDSDLFAQFLIDDKNIAIQLFEYKDRKVTAFTKTEYTVTVLDDDGIKHSFEGVMNKGGDRVFVQDRALLTLLKNNEILEIYLKDEFTSTYLFSCERGNFNEVCKLDTGVNDIEDLDPEKKYLLQAADGTYVNTKAYSVDTKYGVKALLGMSENVAEAAEFRVLFKSDGSFCLVCDDMFLYADGNDVRLVEEAGEFTYFVIEPTQGGALIRCKTANYQGKPQYLEVYYDGCLTCYGLNESNLPIYTFNFIPLD